MTKTQSHRIPRYVSKQLLSEEAVRERLFLHLSIQLRQLTELVVQGEFWWVSVNGIIFWLSLRSTLRNHVWLVGSSDSLTVVASLQFGLPYLFHFRTMIALKNIKLVSCHRLACNTTSLCKRQVTSCALPFDALKNPSVIISRSECIYENLGLEDWLYERLEPHREQQILLMWRSRPCIVIGKFQNQWRECNVGKLGTHCVQLGESSHVKFVLSVAFILLNLMPPRFPVARRKSGGGTVYHDLGNINMSFITHRDSYDRKQNLTFICQILKSRWPHLNLSINDRDDIILDQKYKVSRMLPVH